jgi:hypothetical protein
MKVRIKGGVVNTRLDWKLLKKNLFSISYLEFAENEILRPACMHT